MIHHLMEKSNIKQKQNECQEIEKNLSMLTSLIMVN